MRAHAVIASEPRANALADAIGAIPSAWFQASPAIYWCDFVISAGIGWAALAAAVSAASGLSRAGFELVATAALYRAGLFIHEITHRARRDVPLFRLAWNAIVGVPVLLPSFLYEGVHLDHHRQRCYGTPADPEYLPYGRRRPALIVFSVLASILFPVFAVVRFGVIAPLSWIVPALGTVIRERFSALVINTRYVRTAPIGWDGRTQEAAACAFVWVAAWLWLTGRLPGAAIVCWAAAMSLASLVNAVRTLAAHRYDSDEDELTMVEQLLDSCTIASAPSVTSVVADACRAIVAPVGLRYHALHHWIPSLPYHSLGRVHRRLVGALAGNAPYRRTVSPGFLPVIRDLFRRSRAQS